MKTEPGLGGGKSPVEPEAAEPVRPAAVIGAMAPIP